MVPLATSEPFGQTAFHLPLWPFSVLILPAVHFGKYWAFGAFRPATVVVLIETSGAPTLPAVVLPMPSFSAIATGAGFAADPWHRRDRKLPLYVFGAAGDRPRVGRAGRQQAKKCRDR